MQKPTVLITGATSGIGRATARAFLAPASQAFLPMVVGRKALPPAIAAQSIAFQTGAIAGPALGGVIVGFSIPLAYASALALFAAVASIAVVVGEYGETKGLVTLEDVVETLLGIEILDEGDKVEDMQQLARQLWAKRAERMGIRIDET